MAKTFREWSIEQRWLLPPSVQELVPSNHVAHFIRELVREELDLSEIFAAYNEERGAPPFHPTMMTALLLYAYSQGVYSSRKIARGCEERVDFMAVTALQRPDFRTVSEFRRRHLAALEGLFKQVLRLCQRAGMVKLGHVALEVPKVRAKAQRNFTDPESRILKTSDGFIQGYNAQLAVDGAHQVIVAHDVKAEQNDAPQLPVMVAQIKANTGRQVAELSADNGYFSESNLRELTRRHVRGYIAPGRTNHGNAERSKKKHAPRSALAREMTARVRRGGHRSRYRLRKQIVEPVNGHIKEARSFRRFSMRGMSKVRGEWSMLCTVHNLLKLASTRG